MMRAPFALALAIALPLSASAEEPLSAIPWLTESLSAPVTVESDDTLPVSNSIDEITVEVLSDQPRDGVGLLKPEVTGFPMDLWRGSSAFRVRSLLEKARYGGVPANSGLFRKILLAETNPPNDDVDATRTLVSRIDRLLEIGALEEAEALIEKAGPDTADLFRRWFDIGLLTGRSQEACDLLTSSPMLSPSKSVQVFCLAQNKDWAAAATTLTLGEQLGQISQPEADLLHFFLDEGLLEEVDAPPFQKPFTSLEFLIRESVGLPRPNFPIPLAFLHMELADYIPVRYRMEAGEKLVRNDVLHGSILFAAYREEDPAASGGIWDRAKAVQTMDEAATADEISRAFIALDRQLYGVGLRYAAAQEYLTYLSALPPAELPTEIHDLAAMYLLLADAPDVAQNWITNDSNEAVKAAQAISTRTYEGAHPFLQPFNTTTPEAFLGEDYANLIALGRTGEALLKATDGLARKYRDEDDIIEDIAALLSLGQIDAAHEIAVETILLPLEPPDANALD